MLASPQHLSSNILLLLNLLLQILNLLLLILLLQVLLLTLMWVRHGSCAVDVFSLYLISVPPPNHHSPYKAIQLVHWKEPKRTAVAFSLSLLVLFSVATLSVISVVSYLLLTCLCVTITFRWGSGGWLHSWMCQLQWEQVFPNMFL